MCYKLYVTESVKVSWWSRYDHLKLLTFELLLTNDWTITILKPYIQAETITCPQHWIRNCCDITLKVMWFYLILYQFHVEKYLFSLILLNNMMIHQKNNQFKLVFSGKWNWESFTTVEHTPTCSCVIPSSLSWLIKGRNGCRTPDIC